ncbi:MAG TPA: ATP-binding protein, partial [Chitinophagaceae bacterium]
LREQVNIIKHIQEMLTIQRQYVAGHTALEKKAANLHSIVNDCMAMLYASLEKRGIRVAINIPPDLPRIKADHTRLMQVVLNLLKNSLEAIPLNAEQKLISIDAVAAGDVITLQMHDTGHGFDDETGRQLFVRGFTTKASGTGLGLANCRAIVEGHNGTIGISSEGFGKGATTTIKFKKE